MSEDQTPLETWNRARTLLLESLYKPDHQLRSCAYNQQCKDELMAIRDQVIDMVQSMPNPHTPPLPFGKKNSFVTPTVTTPAGEISINLATGALENFYKNWGKKDE
tara:strand:+ start:54 stop:371 length:318 start_codon:yes stop_codon:yes gene_type:complete